MHRDISINNLMLYGLVQLDDTIRRGFLIDLDYASDEDKNCKLGWKPPLSPKNMEEHMKRQMAVTEEGDIDRGQRTVSLQSFFFCH